MGRLISNHRWGRKKNGKKNSERTQDPLSYNQRSCQRVLDYSPLGVHFHVRKERIHGYWPACATARFTAACCKGARMDRHGPQAQACRAHKDGLGTFPIMVQWLESSRAHVFTELIAVCQCSCGRVSHRAVLPIPFRGLILAASFHPEGFQWRNLQPWHREPHKSLPLCSLR